MYLQGRFCYAVLIMVEALDDRDVKILRHLAKREVRGEGPPTVREVAGAGGFGSSRSGGLRLAKLAEGGFVEWGVAPSRKRRPVRLTRSGWEVVGEMPVLGRIAAGPGMDAVGVEGARLGLWRGILAGESFLLEVRGDSMRGAGIEDGDSVIVERHDSPEDGEIVAALLYGETVTVKRLLREGERVRLKAENPAYEDIVVDGADVVIQGRVRGLIRSLAR